MRAMEPLSPEDRDRVFESSPVALLVCDETRIHCANASCADMLGRPDALDVCSLHPLTDLVSPADQPAFSAALRRLLRGEAPSERLWLRVSRGDGSTFPAHVLIQSLAEPGGGRVFISMVDVSDQRAEALQASRLARAVNLVSEAVLIAEGDSRIVYANRAMGALLGTSEDLLIGTSALALLTDTEAIDRIVTRLSAPGPDRHVTVQLDIRAFTGRVFPAEISVTIFREPDDGREMGIVVARDLTEAKRLEQERALRERQLGLMLREAHHRIKNNLQVASDILALQAGVGAPAVREALADAARRIRALAAVHEGIRADQDVTEVQAKPLIAAVVHDLKGLSGPTGAPASFEITLEEHPVTSQAASALALITAELVGNALEHARPDTLRVWFWAADGTGVLEVRDNGARDPRPLEPAASGFGLRLVRLLAAEQLRGEFSLAREAEWTVARVRFPLQAGPA